MKTKILRALRNTEEYISGQELCEQFGISRTAVWKYINKLKEEGYKIEAIQNRGYHMISCPDVLTESEIQSRIQCKWAGNTIEYFEEIDSTNNYAKKIGEMGGRHGTLVIAETQTDGKGRRGRGWKSVQGKGIWMSLLLKPILQPDCASMLTLLAAYSLVKAIEGKTGLSVGIKWPNDLVLNKKKICGILTEMSSELEQIHYVVIGMGLNVNITSFPEDIAETATSLFLESQNKYNRADIIAKFLEIFEKDYEIFIENKNFHSMKDEYNQHLINCNKIVKILDPKGEYCAKALGIDDRGFLLVEKDTGEIEAVGSGEVSVRGVYGYV